MIESKYIYDVTHTHTYMYIYICILYICRIMWHWRLE